MGTRRVRLQNVLLAIKPVELEAGASSLEVSCHHEKDVLSAVQIIVLPHEPEDSHYVEQARHSITLYLQPFSKEILQQVYNSVRHRLGQEGEVMPAHNNKKQLRWALASYVLQDDETDEGEFPPDNAMQPSEQPDVRRNARQAGNSAITVNFEAAADSQVCEELPVKGPAKQATVPLDVNKSPYQLHVDEDHAAQDAAEQAPLLQSAAVQSHEAKGSSPVSSPGNAEATARRGLENPEQHKQGQASEYRNIPLGQLLQSQGQDLVGEELLMYWPDYTPQWWQAVVVSYEANTQEHRLLYPDANQEEQVDLRTVPDEDIRRHPDSPMTTASQNSTSPHAQVQRTIQRSPNQGQPTDHRQQHIAEQQHANQSTDHQQGSRADAAGIGLTAHETAENQVSQSPTTAKPQQGEAHRSPTAIQQKLAAWQHISENVYLHRSRNQEDEDDVFTCACKKPADASLGCGADCINRATQTECSKDWCPCGQQCSNQMFTKKQYPRLGKRNAGQKGFGLFTCEDLKADQFIIEYVGEVLDDKEYQLRKLMYQSSAQPHWYMMSTDNGEAIDATTKGCLGRFMNHSCEPNCKMQKWQVHGETAIGLFALQDINTGQELSLDYNFQTHGEQPVQCFCGAAKCRGFIGNKKGAAAKKRQTGASKQTLSAPMPPAPVMTAAPAGVIASTAHAQATRHKTASQLSMANPTPAPAGVQPLQTFATDAAPPPGSNPKPCGPSALGPAHRHRPKAAGLSMPITDSAVASKSGTNCNPVSESALHKGPGSRSSTCAEAQAACPQAAQPSANALFVPGLAALSASLTGSATEVAAAFAPPSEVSAAPATATGSAQAAPPSESATAAPPAGLATAQASAAGSTQAAPQPPGQAQRYRPDQVVETLERGLWWPAQVCNPTTTQREILKMKVNDIMVVYCDSGLISKFAVSSENLRPYSAEPPPKRSTAKYRRAHAAAAACLENDSGFL